MPSSDDLWSAYDGMGDLFRRHAQDAPYNAHYDRPAVLAALGPVKGLRVLDAACGPGLYLSDLLDAGADAVGFDASQTMVDLARERVGDRAAIDQAVLGERLPYPDGSFDRAICALAIHYVEHPFEAFAELNRILRPGGLLVISTQHPTIDWLRKGGSYFERRLETDTWRFEGGQEQEVRFWRIPLSDLCDAALEAGFLIDRLIEPRPAESMRTGYPMEYERLMREPGFLILRLRSARSPS